MQEIPNNIIRLFEGKIVYLATASSSGKPNLVCVSVNKVIGNKVIVTDNMFNQTRINIRKNPKASIAFYYLGKAFQLKGIISYQTKGKWFDYVKKDPSNKGYSPTAAVVFNVNEIWDLDKGKRVL